MQIIFGADWLPFINLQSVGYTLFSKCQNILAAHYNYIGHFPFIVEGLRWTNKNLQRYYLHWSKGRNGITHCFQTRFWQFSPRQLCGSWKNIRYGSERHPIWLLV